MEPAFSRVLIKDTRNKILVVQDRADDWNLPGGKQEAGETPLECAKREVKEEIGIDVSDLIEIYNGFFYFGDIKWHGYFYFANAASGIATVNEIEKIKGIQFIKDLKSVKFHSELSRIMDQLSVSKQLQTSTTTWK
ncbi:NUDIX hydrolase [Peribacillus frigoritolerans]|uniref:NUDIX hydrolase n=1 Tax=Peribacillus frigoritolerans TaxID=450367 RepID=UPI00105A48A0|nr:NUDIX hydrolase [Peribacillus frigoritolerans]TDL82413.1 NUDIX hydrolase [Peribacillus frigoritolerans]